MTRSTRLAAQGFVALSAIVVAFQCALAAGAPWGELTLGGRWRGVLPAHMRVAVVISALVNAAAAALVASCAGLTLSAWRSTAQRLVGLITTFYAIGIVMNAITPSPRERMLWLPVTIAMTLCAGIVARNARR
jgi:hypothetical protein